VIERKGNRGGISLVRLAVTDRNISCLAILLFEEIFPQREIEKL
jgi:hypothetical protein